MFKSQYSGRLYPAGTKPVRLVIAQRPKQYKNEDGKISHGYETVKEIIVGPNEVDNVKGALNHG